MTYTDKVIDYLLSPEGYDTCGHCVNYIPYTEDDELRAGGAENLITCKQEKHTCDKVPKSKCREGIKAWFKCNG